MNVVLITPSNLDKMPYLKIYTEILSKNQIKYDIINWDRNQTEVNNTLLSYRDKKNASEETIWII